MADDGVLKPRLHERFFACDGDAIFLKIVASPARGENRVCSHPRTGDATDEKIAEKNREKFNELNFLRQNHGLRQRVATHAIFAARWRRDNFKKIASPSQAKNRSCSRGLSERKDRDREICSVWNEKKAVQIGFTKVALGKFIDQNDEVMYFTR